MSLNKESSTHKYTFIKIQILSSQTGQNDFQLKILQKKMNIISYYLLNHSLQTLNKNKIS